MRRKRPAVGLMLLVVVSGAIGVALTVAQETPPAPGGSTAGAPDPVKVAPSIYKVTTENDRVRILDVHLPSGQTSPMHSHPAYVACCFSAGKVRFTLADGTSKEVEFKPGDTYFSDAESHSVENIGGTELHAVNIELKQPSSSVVEGRQMTDDRAVQAAHTIHEHVVNTPEKMTWQAAPAGLPAGAQMLLLEGDPAKPGPFAVRFKAPAGYTILPHWHPADEHLTIMSGSLYMGTGDTLDRSKAEKIPTGSYTVMPAKMHHFAYSDEEVVIQLHGIGPWAINYINPTDDPRRK